MTRSVSVISILELAQGKANASPLGQTFYLNHYYNTHILSHMEGW